MRKHSYFFILLFLSYLILFSLFSGCLSVTPETVVTGTIYGYVASPDDTARDLTGYTPIAGATVTIVDADGVTHTVITDQNGYYCFNNISVKVNTIINIEKDTEDGGKLIFKDIVPLTVSVEEDYDAGIADVLSTATALVVEELVNLGQVQEEIDLDEICSCDGFDELKEDVQQAQEDNQDINTDNQINTHTEEIADNIVNPPIPTPEPEPEPEPTPDPTPDPTPAPTPTYTVTYDDNESTGTAPIDSSSYTEGATVTVLGNTGETVLSKTGYDFNGWNTLANGDGTAQAAGSTFTMGTSDVTLYAQWTIVSYTVTYNNNTSTGGTVPTPVDYNYEATVTVLGNTGSLVKTDYAFAGWNTQAGGNGMYYNVPDYVVPDTFNMGAENVTLYAQWDVISIGVSYGGGIVAYILQGVDSGYDANVQHGLIAAIADQSTGIQWYNGSDELTGATGVAIGTGQANTTAIVNIQGVGSYAAKLCDDYTNLANGTGVYNDWFLPSKDELNKLYENKDAIGGFADADAYYWSSSEGSASLAWYQVFVGGNQDDVNKAYDYFLVRAVRDF